MVCELCHQNLQAAEGCIPHTIVPDARRAFSPIPFGDEREGWKRIGLRPPGRCRDCNAKLGELHHPGCDIERCPVCAVSLQDLNIARQWHGLPPIFEAEDAGMQAMVCVHCRDRRPHFAPNAPAPPAPELPPEPAHWWKRFFR